MTPVQYRQDAGLKSSDTRASSLADDYRRFVWRRVLCLGGLTLAAMTALLVDIASGPSMLGLMDVFRGLLNPEGIDAGTRVIIEDIRLPYALMAVVVGACLGLAGAEMQTVLNNPLASPFTLGVGAAATLGASLVIAFNISVLGLAAHVLLPLSAFVFAAAASLLILVLSRTLGASVHAVVLFGIALLFGINAVVGLIQFMADAESVQQIVFWTMGSLARASLDKVAIVALVLALCLPFSLRNAWAMTLLRSGEEQARSLGIRVERMRLVVLMRVSLLTAAAMCFVGEIGFIGLVAPHIARLMLGEDHRFLLPGSALAGAVLLSLSSIASKLLVPGVVLPVGIVTALVGIPLFITLIIGRSRRAAL
ncbi:MULTISPECIES: FecCD family ABC transporter permease [Marinobacter]|jgi:iron complex transport system permease protein|uniref:Iron(III) dicitrate transport system permease protein FecD n=1 Tax=Marinobacter nauticus TaxID=2743 RepID=A0A833JRH0_MARNT|nr:MULTISPECIES: iron ABC transporter permease [Marinobacter]MCG8522217.1 iron ABC transporter permease [Pseudomonadales bacterium]ERS83173.1 iron-siderophore ABC transporter permease [Marinobacter sp. C1S70]KAE8546373.1 Iron(III) dicitrate transport system permease protein FecD [Marinobacter nauticus]MBY6103873.1 iron ABC transporter permease [Marinobacter nauticus]MBY6220204.1 iron ABC transporter permease [Marinobacter nauticus]